MHTVNLTFHISKTLYRYTMFTERRSLYLEGEGGGYRGYFAADATNLAIIISFSCQPMKMLYFCEGWWGGGGRGGVAKTGSSSSHP